MELDLDKNRFSARAVGHDKVFLYLPKYIDGYLVWLQYVWKRYQYQFDDWALFPRYKKKTISHIRFEQKIK